MRYLAIVLFVLSTAAPGLAKKRSPMTVVQTIFREYIARDESTESETNRASMQKALIDLQSTARSQDVSLLLDVWMYYDPTDFPTRDLIRPIFLIHRTATLRLVNGRIKHPKKWESTDSAPYTDLISLSKDLSK